MKISTFILFCTFSISSQLALACPLTDAATKVGETLEEMSDDNLVHEFIWWLANTFGPNIPTDTTPPPEGCESPVNNFVSHTYPHVDGLTLSVIANQEGSEEIAAWLNTKVDGQALYRSPSFRMVENKSAEVNAVAAHFTHCDKGAVVDLFLIQLERVTVAVIDTGYTTCDEDSPNNYINTDDLWMWFSNIDGDVSIQLRDGSILDF